VASINRDTSGLNGSVSKNPDLNGLLASQADSMNAAQAAGQTVAQAIGDYASKKQAEAKDPADAAAWSEGGTNRVLLHMAGGALVAGLGGGNALGGAIGAGVSAKMAGELNDISKGIGSDTGSPLIGNIASNIIAGTAGALVGGSSGAFAASNADLYNRQLHPDEKDAIAGKANGDTAEEKRLTDAACYAVQCWAQYSPNSDEWAANYVSPERAGELGPELAWVKNQQSADLFTYWASDWTKDFASQQVDIASRGLANLADQFAYLVRKSVGQNAPQYVDPLTDAMNGGDPPSGTAGAVVTPPVVVCVPNQGCTSAPSLVLPGTSGYVPSNATFNSGNDGSSNQAPHGTQSNVDLGSGQQADDSGVGSGKNSAANAVNGVRLNNQLASDEIANGHAFDKHVVEQNEFGDSITTQEQFANQIENILNNPSATKQLSNGRSAYWDDTSGMVVIRNPKAVDGGTAFKPTNGKAYFDSLR